MPAIRSPTPRTGCHVITDVRLPPTPPPRGPRLHRLDRHQLSRRRRPPPRPPPGASASAPIRSWHAPVEQAQRHRPRWVALTGRRRGRRPATCLTAAELLRGADGMRQMVHRPRRGHRRHRHRRRGRAWPAPGPPWKPARPSPSPTRKRWSWPAPWSPSWPPARGGRLLPVDSEHSAIFQALQGSRPGAVERIVLTGSGGPFRGRAGPSWPASPSSRPCATPPGAWGRRSPSIRPP